MSTLKLINQKITLEKVKFEKKEDFQGSLKVILKDDCTNFLQEGKNISFNFTRKIRLEPSCLFEIEVIFKYCASIEENSYLNLEKENKKITKSNLYKIINNTNVPQTASQIISNLTLSFNGNPLITAPFAVEEK